jgi:hypothetical protein
VVRALDAQEPLRLGRRLEQPDAKLEMRADDDVQDCLCRRAWRVGSRGNAGDRASDVPPRRRAIRVRDPLTIRMRRNGARNTLLWTRMVPPMLSCGWVVSMLKRESESGVEGVEPPTSTVRF